VGEIFLAKTRVHLSANSRPNADCQSALAAFNRNGNPPTPLSTKPSAPRTSDCSDVRSRLVLDDAVVNLSQRDADIAVRMFGESTPQDLRSNAAVRAVFRRAVQRTQRML
jgi:hypothetical protein